MKSKQFRVVPSLLTVIFILPVLAQADVTLYGKANVSLQHTDDGEDSYLELVSNASRIGVKGSEDLDNGLKAIYTFEYETSVDDGDKDGQTFDQRNIYVGLTGDFGTVQGGKFDTPFKTAQNKIDLFNDLVGDIKNGITPNDNRPSNVVAYTSPEAPVVGQLALVMSEEDGVDNGISASLAYSNDNLYVAFAADQDVEEMDSSAYRLVAQYIMGDFQFGLLGESYEGANEESNSGIFGSVMYKMDKWALKAQVGQSDIIAEGSQSISIGADYKMAKNVKAFGYLTSLSADDAEDESALGLGMEYKF